MTTFIKVSSFGEELYINTANIAFFKEYDDKRVEVTFNFSAQEQSTTLPNAKPIYPHTIVLDVDVQQFIRLISQAYQ